MPALEYQTFPSTNHVFIGADALVTITTGTDSHPHTIDIRDRDRQAVVKLFLTTDALLALRNHIAAILDDPAEVASWAARDLAGLALREAMVVSPYAAPMVSNLLTSWMVTEGYDADSVAEAVRKPWAWADELEQAKADLTGRDLK